MRVWYRPEMSDESVALYRRYWTPRTWWLTRRGFKYGRLAVEWYWYRGPQVAIVWKPDAEHDLVLLDTLLSSARSRRKARQGEA